MPTTYELCLSIYKQFKMMRGGLDLEYVTISHSSLIDSVFVWLLTVATYLHVSYIVRMIIIVKGDCGTCPKRDPRKLSIPNTGQAGILNVHLYL